MKKRLFYVVACVLCLSLTGCAESIIKDYPEVENDFLKSDYKHLDEISNNRQLSYEELLYAFLEDRLEEKTYKIITNLKEVAEVSNLKCHKNEELLSVTFDLEYEGEIQSFAMTTDTIDFKMKTINFKKCDSGNMTQAIIRSIEDDYYNDEEKDKKVAYDVYRGLTREHNLNNKIYIDTENYYYLPIEDNDEIRCYGDAKDIDKQWQSSSTYWRNSLKENDKRLDELDKDLDQIEEDITKIYGSPRRQ